MPVELISKSVDLDLIYPGFVEPMLDVLARCKARGVNYYWTSGTRFIDEQRVLRARYLRRVYIQNLAPAFLTPALKAELAGLLKLGAGRAAAAGYSGHQFGFAGDFTHDSDLAKAGLQPDWVAENYVVLREEIERAGGLASGWGYGDKPHANLKGTTTGDELAVYRRIWRITEGDDRARLKACWAHRDAHPFFDVAA